MDSLGIYNLVARQQAQLQIPAFTRGKLQLLLPCVVENTISIAQVRIHIERVIGLLQNKFGILAGPLPITLFSEVHP